MANKNFISQQRLPIDAADCLYDASGDVAYYEEEVYI